MSDSILIHTTRRPLRSPVFSPSPQSSRCTCPILRSRLLAHHHYYYTTPHHYTNTPILKLTPTANMSAANPRYYYSLPTEAPQRSRSGSRRPPLTPSTVSSPCLTTLVPTTSRRDSATSGSPIKASILLAKVASSPTTPRGETPPGSPMLSPRSRLNSEPSYSSDRPAMSRTESDRYVRQYRQQGKHTQPNLP